MFHQHVSCHPRCIPGRSAWALAALLCVAGAPVHSASTGDGHLFASISAAPAAAAFSTTVRFSNPTSYRRVEWGLATVPFPEGVWKPGQSFSAVGLPSELTPFGARWPDGSIRFAQLAVLLDMQPQGETLVRIQRGAPANPPFAVSPWMAEGLNSFSLFIAAQIPNQGTQYAQLKPTALTRNDAARKTITYRGRIPKSDFVVDLGLTLFSDADHAPFELRITSSSTASKNWYQSVSSIELWLTGAFANVRGAKRRGVTVFPPSSYGPNVVTLMGEFQTFFDGQGQSWCGELMFAFPGKGGNSARSEALRTTTLAAITEFPLFGVSTDWASSGAFGPFEYVPPPPPWILDGGRSATAQNRATFEAWLDNWGNPWDDWPFGLFPQASQTGEQHDFGAAKLMEIFASGMPYGIEEARLNAGEEALRPVHHREASGAPVLHQNHQNWVSWDGRTHFNQTISPDRLGKPFPGASVDANGWYGRDTEHWSSLTLAAAYLLTGSDSLRYELDNEAELYMSSNTLPSEKPNFATNGIGAARAVGRTLLSMSWNYLCTGRNDLKNHMVARVNEVVFPQGMLTRVAGPVRPVSVRQPDSRVLNRTNWRPWEEAQAAMGLEACALVTGSVNAHLVAISTAATLMKFGWTDSPDGLWVGTAIGWKPGGVPLTTAEYADPTWVLWSTGTNFNMWSLPAVRLALRFAVETNDPTLLTIAQFVDAKVTAKRFKPAYSVGWDSFSEWEAVK